MGKVRPSPSDLLLALLPGMPLGVPAYALFFLQACNFKLVHASMYLSDMSARQLRKCSGCGNCLPAVQRARHQEAWPWEPSPAFLAPACLASRATPRALLST